MTQDELFTGQGPASKSRAIVRADSGRVGLWLLMDASANQKFRQLAGQRLDPRSIADQGDGQGVTGATRPHSPMNCPPLIRLSCAGSPEGNFLAGRAFSRNDDRGWGGRCRRAGSRRAGSAREAG